MTEPAERPSRRTAHMPPFVNMVQSDIFLSFFAEGFGHYCDEKVKVGINQMNKVVKVKNLGNGQRYETQTSQDNRTSYESQETIIGSDCASPK